MKLDALTTTWFENQLRLLEAKSYTRKTPALTARSVFPVDATSNPYAKSISFMTFDEVGEAAIVADGALDAPSGDIAGSETAYPVAMIATKFDMSNWEIEAARKLGVDLNTRQVDAAFNRVDRYINKIAFAGEASRNIPGLGNDSDITPVAATNGGWIAGDSADNALEDLIVAYAAQQDACGGMHEVTDLLLPVSEYNWLATKKLSATSDRTLLEWITAALPFLSSPANVHKVPEMKNFYSSSHECFTLYNKTPECMELKIPQEITFTPPRDLDLGQRVVCYARCGGLHIHFPKSVYIVYGI
jgi:hypothetical protein